MKYWYTCIHNVHLQEADTSEEMEGEEVDEEQEEEEVEEEEEIVDEEEVEEEENLSKLEEDNSMDTEEVNAGEATPLSMPSGMDSADVSLGSPDEPRELPNVEVFELQESSSEDVSPDMESHAMFIKLKEVCHTIIPCVLNLRRYVTLLYHVH